MTCEHGFGGFYCPKCHFRTEMQNLAFQRAMKHIKFVDPDTPGAFEAESSKWLFMQLYHIKAQELQKELIEKGMA